MEEEYSEFLFLVTKNFRINLPIAEKSSCCIYYNFGNYSGWSCNGKFKKCHVTLSTMRLKNKTPGFI